MANILTLPDDIVRELFEHASLNDPVRSTEPEDDHSPEQRYYLGWIYLTHVCRRLRTIGLDTASLWASHVTAIPARRVADVFLSRAKGCGLTIGIHDMHSLEHRYAYEDVELSLWAFQHLHRARTVYCDGPYFLSQYVGELGTPPVDDLRLLSLLHLVIGPRNRSKQSNIETLESLKLEAPRLSTARLCNTLLHPTSPLSNLRELEMSFDRKLKKFHLEQVLRQLECTPKLESLTLREEWDRILATQEAPRIQLDDLKSIDVCLKSVAKMAKFLESVCAPNLSAARLNIIDARKIEPLPAALFMPLNSIHHSLPAIELFVTSHGLLVASADPEDLHGSSFFYDAGLQKPVAFGLYLCELDARMHAECLERVLTHMGPALGRVRRCELGEPSSRGFPSSDIALGSAIGELGSALIAATTLGLDLGAKGLRILDFIGQGAASLFPALRTLMVTVNTNDDRAKGFDDITPAESCQALKSMLTLRVQAGITLQRLELRGLRAGCRSGMHSSRDYWTLMAEQCLAQGLVHAIVDLRMTRECGRCDWLSGSYQ